MSISICDLKNKQYIPNVYKIEYLHKNSIFNHKNSNYDTYNRIKVNKNIICFYSIDNSKYNTSTIYDISNGLLLEHVYTSYNNDNLYVRSRFGKLILYDGNEKDDSLKETSLEEINIQYTITEEKEEYLDTIKGNIKAVYIFNYSDIILRRNDTGEYYRVPSNLEINKRVETNNLFDNDVIYKYFDGTSNYCFSEPLEKLESVYIEDEDYDIVRYNNMLVYIKGNKVLKITDNNQKELSLNKKSTSY